jgi:hypothetical protein
MLKRLAYVALCVCAPLYAAPPIDNDRLQQLANTHLWISLGHYETAKLGGWRSYVDDPEFFLAADGAHDPAAELSATLNAIYAPASGNPTVQDKHAQCVYPARTRFLREQLHLTDLPAVDCKAFNHWFKDIAPDSTVLIFPAAI